jgi:amino acid adenylation domain-containing protein
MPEDAGSPSPTLLDVMRQRAERYQDKIALDYCHYVPGGEVHSRLTYHELDIKARGIASTLQRQGVRGERVLVLCPSGLDFIASFFGCIYAGAVAVPVHPPVRNRVIGRVASIVADAQASFVLTTAELQAQLKDAVDDLAGENSLQWCAADAVDPAAAAEWVAPDVDASATALVQYTSGSTTSPKGIVVTHRNLLANLDAIREAWGHGNDDAVAVFWLPLHHDMGLIGSILETLYVGCTSYLMPPEAFIERPMRWLEAISRHGGTITTAPNFAYELCVERSTVEERAALDLSSWTTAMCGAEPVRAATLQRFADAFSPAGFRPEAFNPVYGLAEATLLASGRPDWVVPVVRHVDGVALREQRVVNVGPEHPAATSFVGCGRAQRGHEIVIVDPVTRQPCAAGEVGEIWLAGGSVAEGYRGRPAETEETFSAFLADTGRGPFLRTGDLGFDLDGELFVTGRLKDLIVIRGRNYYPEDVEATAQDSHPALLRGRGAAFSGTPQSGGSERLIVAQEVDRDRIVDIEVSAVIDAIRTAITEHHEIQPDAVVLLEPSRIPTTSSGKIRRSSCRQRFLDGDLEVFAEWHARSLPDPRPPAPRANPAPDGEGCGAEEIAAWFVAQLSQDLGLSPTEIDTSLSFAHYGLDSVRAIRLTAALEARLQRELSPTLAYEYPTIDVLSKHLAEEALADERRVAAAETDGDRRAAGTDEPIAIVGIGCRFPGADGPAAFWRLLCDGVDAVTELPPDRWGADAPETPATRWGGFLDQVDQFDPQFFGISPREAARMDPQQRLLLEVAWEALEDAGQVPKRLAGSRTGVFVGISTYDYGHFQLGQPALIDAYTGTGAALSIAANRLSYFYDFRGPSMTIDTACSSSLVAIHLAYRSLRDGECTLALVGGANVILSPALGMNFSEAGVMAADGRCKTFDSRADGYVRGEGAGIVVLKPMSRALADGDPIYAVIRGSATNQDGRTNGLMAPSLQSQEEVLAEAYRRADLSPGVVQYVEAHGTGTSVGDAIEAKALGTILAQGRTPGSRCLVGSVKTNIGHLEAAAGVAGLIKVALTLRHRAIPPSLHFTEPNPLIPFDNLPLHVAQTLTPWPENGGRAVAGVSAFGFGGTNAHIVLTEAPQARVTPPQDHTGPGRVELLPLSARSPEALAALAGRYELALAAGVPLADLCYTAGARRGHHDHRLAVVADTSAELCESLAAYRQGVPRPGLSAGRCRPDQQPGVVFVFSGQGSQWHGMGQRLHAQEPVFRDALARCDSAMRPHLDGSVVAELLADQTQSRLSDIGVIQPAIFAVQVALAALWRSWGVEPKAVVGHSLGEVAAAHIAGALSLEDAARVICGRARLLRRANGSGAMLATELSPAEAQDLIAGCQSRVAVAATNSHRSTVLSGDAAALADLATELEQRGRFCRWVEVDVASHSPQMNALRADLNDALAEIRPVPATIPMYSTVTGDLVTDRVLDAAYWVENLCSPVRFSAAVRRLLDLGRDTFLEISPHPILLSAVGEDAADLDRACTLLPSMRRDERERATMLASLGTFYTRGQSVAWEQLHPSDARCVAAPTYPWQRDRFWLDPIDTGNAPTERRVRGSVALPAATLLKPVVTGAMRAFGAARRLLPSDLRQGLNPPPIADLLRAAVGKPAAADANGREASLSDDVRRADRPERKRLLESYLRDQVAAKFGLTPSNLDIELPLNHLGVDSLIALELRTQIERDLGIVVPVVQLLDAPSVADLADRLSSTGPAESDPAAAADPGATLSRLPEVPDDPRAHPLSYGQRSLWFLYQLAPGSPAYTITYAGRISGDLDVTALERAAQALVDRHAILRTTYAVRDGQPVQLVHPQWPVGVVRHDVDSDELHEWIRREANRPFDLQAGRVFRLTLLRPAPDELVLVLAVHHIAVDFWSIDVMLDELRLLYAAEHGSEPPPACPERYVDYADRQARMLAGAEGDRLWNYWRDQLAGELPPNLQLPIDRPRGAVQTYRGAVHRFTLDSRLADGLRDVGRRARTTPYMTLFAAYATLLHRYSGQDDLLIGSPFGCRDQARLHSLVGYLANPVVLRADMHGDPTFTSLLGRVKETVLGALAHQDYPFAMLVERLRPARDLSHTPLYQASFAWEQPRRFHDGTGGAPGRAALDLETVHIGQGGAPMDLMMQVGDTEGQFICQLQYNTDLFDDATIERMAGHFTTLLDGIVADPGTCLSELPLLTEAERRAQAQWNDTGVCYDAPDCLHDMVAATVRRSPHAVAVSFADDELTYAELDRRAEALAHRLQRLGVGSDSIVPVLLDRSADLVVTLLGVLKAGGAFMPVDPAQPVNRIAAIMSNAPGVPVCVTHRQHLERLPEFTGHRLCLDLPETPEPADAVAVDAGTTSDSLAYVSHTSGSTGVPKGALNTHGAICNLLLWMQATYQLNPDGRVLHHTPITFDASVAEIFWPLTVGARLVIAQPEGHKDAAYLVRTIIEQSITAVHFVPWTLRAVLAEPAVTSCVGLRTVTCGGEALSYELAQHFLGTLDAELWNEYGPAETAVTVTGYRCERGAPGRTVPIGRPVANIRIHLLDADLQPVPVGVPGELFIGGVGVGRGYLNRPDATDASFIVDPFGGDPQDPQDPRRMLYRTGDLARYLPDGNIEYLGRLDDQVQIRGVRIEPGEVEATLDKHPGVRENAVVAGDDGRGNTRLVAHIVAASQPAPTTAELRRFLLEWLPAAMVPAVFSIVEALPHTSSGKVDRRALAAADESAPVDGPAFVAPRTHAEKILGGIWREVLGLERIGVHNDFFALGGSSTHSLEVAVRAKAAGLPLQPESVFLFGTIAELAAEYDQAAEDAPDLDEAAQQVDGSEIVSPGVENLPAPVPAVPVRAPGQQTRNTVIESIGSYLPAQAVSTDTVLAGCVNKIGIPLERLTGIKSRRVVGQGEFSIDLARNAVADCLARSSYAPDEIDLVICCNISRFDGPGQIMYEPSTAARLREQCGLPNAIAFDISNACAGMFTGVAVADAFLQTGLVQRAMVVSGEYISHIAETAQREIEGPMDPRLACLTVGDVGAAVILERGPNGRVGFHDIDMATLSRYSKVCVAKASTGPHGGAIMTVDSIAATATAVKRSVPYVAAVMQRHGWRLENCDHILMHQTSQASINDAVFAVNQVFGHAAAHSGNVINNLAERGNTASTTHFVALSDQIRANRIKSGDNVVFGISGSGTTVGTALYTFDDLPARMRRAPNDQRGHSFSTSLRPADPPAMPRVRIEGVGTAPAVQSAPRHAVDLAVQAAAACLDHSGVDPAALDLIVYAGVYRDDFLAEPAIAALVAGELGINDDIESPDEPKTFAFDVLNGAVGFLNACHVGVQMIGAGKAEHVMVAASEIENNSVDDGHPLYGLSETGSAVILGRADGTEGFGRFVFHHHPEYAEALTTYFQHRDGQSWLQIDGDPNLATHYLDCIPGAVEELLKLEELDCSEIAAVFPPYLSDADRTELAARLNIPSSRFVDLAAESDPFSSCLPYGLQQARQHNLVRPGDIGLIVSVGSGVQIGCATYRF